MIRIVLALLLVITIFMGLVLFPDIASQPVRIEMLGWLFETRTGMFILLLLIIIGGLWSLQKVFNLSVNSPRQLWTSLRSGNKKRRELRLQEALATWIDDGKGNSQKLLKRSKNVVPEWLHDSLAIWWDKPGAHLKINDETDTPLTVALKARLATGGEHAETLSLSERQYYLDAWLAAHPAASLALQRKAILLGELGEFSEQVHVFEGLIQKNKDIQIFKPLLAQALYHLAKQDTDHKLDHLRKASRLNPSDTKVIISLSTGLAAAGDSASAERLLLDHLQHQDDMDVAKSALKLMSANALKNFKAIDKLAYKTTVAGTWLRMMLAHQADLTGIAEDALQALLEHHPSAMLWQTKGDWLASKQAWQEATQAYQKSALYK